MRKIPFNVNFSVLVRLTDAGRKAIEKQHKEIYGEHHTRFPVRKITENDQGWSEWKLHDLMQTFGKYMYNGNPSLPFSPAIFLLPPDEEGV